LNYIILLKKCGNSNEKLCYSFALKQNYDTFALAKIEEDSEAQLVEHPALREGTRFFKYRYFDSVAQLVEHIPFKDGVLGSSPSWITL
jgi:hypothetical protein